MIYINYQQKLWYERLRERIKMSIMPVRLERIPPTMRVKEVPKKISVQNSGGRKLIIRPEESGWEKEQIFTSEDLPKRITYELLGFIRFPDGSVYPKYRANTVTKKELWLEGSIGYKNCINTINKVAWWLTWQEKMFMAESIKKSDLECFNYKKENFVYWLSSNEVIPDVVGGDFGPGKVFPGGAAFATIYMLDEKFAYKIAAAAAVRPVMTLASKVKVDNQDDVTWVPL